MNASTLDAARTNFYIIRSYIQWGIEQDLRDDNVNPLNVVSDTEYHRRFVNKARKSLYTKGEIDEIIKNCVNAQDSVGIALLFEGALGTKDYDEILNLQAKHIKENNWIELWDGDKKRTIQVSDQCVNLIDKALAANIYFKKNGDPSENLRTDPELKLVENDFVLRNTKNKSKTTGKASKYLLLRRVAAVKEYNNLNTFTAYIVRNSGMLWMAKQLYDKYGKLEREQYDEISLRFGISKGKVDGLEYYSNHRLKASFLNEETILEMYPPEDN